MDLSKEGITKNCIACGIPNYMIDGIELWILHGIDPGSFLSAVIYNDLFTAVGHADDTNRHLLFNYCNFFYNFAPSSCFGSKEKARKWKGIEKAVAHG